MELDDFQPLYTLNVYEDEARTIEKWPGIISNWAPQTPYQLTWSIDPKTVQLFIYNRIDDAMRMRLKLYLGFDIDD